MRASTDQAITATSDAVDAARRSATGLVSTGADLVASTLDKGAAVLEGGLERVSDKAPVLSVGAARAPRTHRVRTTLIALAVLIGILAIAKKLTAESPSPAAGDRAGPDTGRSDHAEHTPGLGPDQEDPAVPAGSG